MTIGWFVGRCNQSDDSERGNALGPDWANAFPLSGASQVTLSKFSISLIGARFLCFICTVSPQKEALCLNYYSTSQLQWQAKRLTINDLRKAVYALLSELSLKYIGEHNFTYSITLRSLLMTDTAKFMRDVGWRTLHLIYDHQDTYSVILCHKILI